MENFPRKFACFLFSIRQKVFEFLVQQRNGFCTEALFAEFADFTVLSVEEKFKIELKSKIEAILRKAEGKM